MHQLNQIQDQDGGRNGLVYPFSALVGQGAMKQALLLAAVDPSLGGVLILGERGTAKSTAARGLAGLWPGRGGFVTLPLGATEDRVVGSLDFEAALNSGRIRPEPGLLARAHEGVLYIDEVNLLDEHLAALILDASQTGWVQVEREGVGFTYPARFVLVGTMNPEEGQVSPQLLDRFGLAVAVRAELSPGLRKELILRRLAFEADPAGFIRGWSEEEEKLAARLLAARRDLAKVEVEAEMMSLAGRLACEACAAGQRAELALIKAARARAAWQGRIRVEAEDLWAVAELALAHRRREPKEGEASRERQESRRPNQEGKSEPQDRPSHSPDQHQAQERRAGERSDGASSGLERTYEANRSFSLSTLDPSRQGGWLRDSGRRLRRETRDGTGRYVRASMERLGREVALDATFRAAAPNQSRRDRSRLKLVIATSDIREKVKVKTTGRLVLFAVDGSGSMGSLLRMREAKAAVLSLLAEAYQKRDRVGMITFRAEAAEVLLPPTNSVELANRCLEELPTGGKTPLAAGLIAAGQVVAGELRRDPKLNPLVVLLSDGKPNISWRIGADPWYEVLEIADRLKMPGLRWLIVDSDWGHYLSFGLCRELAEKLGGNYIKLAQLRSQGLVKLVNDGFTQRPK